MCNAFLTFSISLYAEPASIAWLREHYSSEIRSKKVVIVSPDAGGVKIGLSSIIEYDYADSISTERPPLPTGSPQILP